MKTRLALLVLCAVALSAAPVTITGTIKRMDGTSATGLATIELSAPCVNGSGQLILDRPRVVRFDAGSFSTSLEPTTACPVTTYYRVRYQMDRIFISEYEYWSVPASPTTTTIAAVRLPVVVPPAFAKATTKGDIAAYDGINWARVAAASDGMCLKTNAAAAAGVEWGTCPAGGGGSGEANTASNLAGGVGLYSTKVGVDLRFKSLLAGSSKVTVVANGSGSTVDIDVVPGQILFSSLQSWPATVDATELGRLDGVTGPIQTQIDGKAATSHTHAAADVTSGLMAAARIATGTPTGSKFLRDDQVWAVPAGGGNVNGPGSATDNFVVVFDGATGTLIKMSGCKIVSGALTCGDGTTQSMIELPELTANGANKQSIYGAANQAGDGCVVWPVGNSTTGQILKDSGSSATIDGKTCRVLGWAADDNSGGGGGGVGEWSSSLNFGTVLDLSCSEQTFTATGLTTGTVLLVVPYSAVGAVAARAWASAADTAKVQVCNSSGGDVSVSGTFTVKAARGYLSGSGTIDFASIPAGTTATATITVTGATTAMGAVPAPPAAFSNGILLTARVTAADTVTLYAANLTDADIDPASGSFTGMVIQ